MSFISKLNNEVEAFAETFGIDESKAFSAWLAKIVLDLDDDDAFDALNVEGPNDKGMDLFWVDDQNRKVFIGQCKYSKNGNHYPKEKDLISLLSCLDWLINPEALETEGRMELVVAANDYVEAINKGYATQLWFAYVGHRDENIDKRIRIFNANEEHQEKARMAIHCDISLIESLFQETRGEKRRIEKAKLSSSPKSFEMSGTFGKGIVTTLKANSLVDLYEEHKDKLFARNVRGWLGARKGSVNAGIMSTVQNETERGNFWAYNNGVTIVCDNYDYDESTGSLEIENFSIVNGCQTTVALSRSKGELADTSVLARIISPPDSIVDSIILFTNSQNRVRRWELVSQDATQRRLKQDFESLESPVYYEIRKGDWNALSPGEKRKFYYEDSRRIRKVKHDLLAQYLASFYGRAVVAYKNKAFLFDRYYEQTFPPDLRVQEALFIWHVGETVQELVREEIRKENLRIKNGENNRSKYVLMLKRGGRFYVVAVFGLIANLRNGPDYLRSIKEKRITSKGANERIEKYGKLAINWYKQAVDDLMQITGTDLSVLIRESDFFDRVGERTTNTYETYSVNEEWLDGALPKLY